MAVELSFTVCMGRDTVGQLANNAGLDPKAQARNAELWEKVFDFFLHRNFTVQKAAEAACEAVTLREMARQHGYAALQVPKAEPAQDKAPAPTPLTFNVTMGEGVTPEQIRATIDKWFLDASRGFAKPEEKR